MLPATVAHFNHVCMYGYFLSPTERLDAERRPQRIHQLLRDASAVCSGLHLQRTGKRAHILLIFFFENVSKYNHFNWLLTLPTLSEFCSVERGTVWRGSDAAGALCDTKRPLTFSSGPGVSSSGRPVAVQASQMKCYWKRVRGIHLERGRPFFKKIGWWLGSPSITFRADQSRDVSQ